MKRKIILFAALVVITINFSSCVVRVHDGHPHHHHWHHHHDGAEVIVR